MQHVVQTQETLNKILIIDDNSSDRELYKIWIEESYSVPAEIIACDNAVLGYRMIEEVRLDAVILDFLMLEMDGFQLLSDLKKRGLQAPPIIFITGAPHSRAMEEDALAMGASAYLNKNTLDGAILSQTLHSVMS